MIIVFYVIPKIILISKKGHLYDEPNHRKLNKSPVPTLGGIGIYLGIIITTVIFTHGIDFEGLKYIFLVVTILLCIGVFDDIFSISAYIKLVYQLSIALLLIGFADIRITSLHGLLGINELNIVVSYFLSTIIIIGLINAINLIDGVDGLASGICLVAVVTLGLLESYVGNKEFAILAFSAAGSLLAFMFFNVFAKKNKIFMGDTGSTILGVLLAILVINICEAEPLYSQDFIIVSPASFTLSLLVIPVFDTIRVLFARVFRGQSMFCADKSHMHHWLLKFGFTHMHVSIIMVLITLLSVGINLWLQGMNEHVLFVLTVLIGILFTGFPSVFVQWIEKRNCYLLRKINVYIWKKTHGSRLVINNIGKIVDRMR
jgi:UDP-N-acetylmuramyl pentapeptide phosphotransferase/UDP-N-acetylglucosamine-1-phosphate transferase